MQKMNTINIIEDDEQLRLVGLRGAGGDSMAVGLSRRRLDGVAEDEIQLVR